MEMRLRWAIGLLGLVLSLPTRGDAQEVATGNRNQEVVRRHLMLVNAGRWKEAAELFAPNVRHHLGSWQDDEERVVQGRETLTRNFEDIFAPFRTGRWKSSRWWYRARMLSFAAE